MKRRHLIVPAVTLIGLACTLEAVARVQELDNLQAVSVSRMSPELQVSRSGSSGEPLGVDYLPRDFEIDESGFTTVWGRCEFDHPGRSILVLGDSTTRAGTPSAQDPGSALSTWPRMLKTSADVQVCVLAEDGYHPADLAAIEMALRPRMTWDLIVAMLCHNDAMPTDQRNLLRGDPGALYHPPPYRLAWAPLWQPWLFQVSEAFRFVHWRLALQDPNPLQIAEPNPTMLVGPSLASLAASPLRLFFLPVLGEHPHGPEAQRQLKSETSRHGLSLEVIDLPEPPDTWRQTPQDRIHLNATGHIGAAKQIRSTLAADPELGDLFGP